MVTKFAHVNFACRCIDLYLMLSYYSLLWPVSLNCDNWLLSNPNLHEAVVFINSLTPFGHCHDFKPLICFSNLCPLHLFLFIYLFYLILFYFFLLLFFFFLGGGGFRCGEYRRISMIIKHYVSSTPGSFFSYVCFCYYFARRIRGVSCDERNIILIQWASYQIPKIVGCACAGNAGNVFPATEFKGNR